MIQFGANPIAFQIGSFTLRWYGLFLALAVLWLIGWMWWRVRKGAKISLDTVLTLALVGIPSGIVFSRLLHVVDNIVIAKVHPELVATGAVIDYTQNWVKIIGGQGLTAWGAVLGASLGIWVYCKITKVKIGYVFDLLAPGIIMAQAIGRIGCLFNGCCYGVTTGVPWGLTYTNPNTLAPLGIATQPTVVYEMFFNVAAFFVLLRLRGKFKPDGSLYLIYLSLYSAWRLGIDFLRTRNTFLLGLDQAQVISIIILLIAIPWMLKNTRRLKPEELAEVPPGPAPESAGEATPSA